MWQQQLGGVTAVKRGVGLVGPYFYAVRRTFILPIELESTVALSSTEAEYMDTTEARKEALWVARFLACLEFRPPSQPVGLRADNKGAISLTKNPEFHRKTKHIEVRWHIIREKVERKDIVISYSYLYNGNAGRRTPESTWPQNV